MAGTRSSVVDRDFSSSFDYWHDFGIDTSEQRRREDGIKPGEKDEFWKYTPLLKAALKGDWQTAEKFFQQHPNAITDPITREKETALYMATGSGPVAIKFVEELLKLMPASAVVYQDIAGHTPLHISAWVGNTDAATLLVEKNPSLLSIRNSKGWLPIHYAAFNTAEKATASTLSFLLEATDKDEASKSMLYFSADRGGKPSGAELLIHVITSEFYDVALNLLHRHPVLAISQTSNYDCGLKAIARKVHAFPSGMKLKYWEDIIYHCVPVLPMKIDTYAQDSPDTHAQDSPDTHAQDSPDTYAKDLSSVKIENPAKKYDRTRSLGKPFFVSVSQKSQAMLWKVFGLLVPHVRQIREQKQKHQQAHQLLKYLIKEMMTLNDLNEYDSLAAGAITSATRLGIHEVIEEIVESVPKLFCCRDSEKRTVFERTVIERHENIFNLIYQMSDHKYSVTMYIDETGNNLMHLAGRLAPPNKLNLISRALQVQRELQWFEEVKKVVRSPSYMEQRNKENETPQMVFTREHKELVVQGGEWMKGTATSCTISAALIVTVVFAAIITVPGGSDNGLPILSKEIPFIVFIISDALSLFTSTTSLLMFLPILASRYAEGDFLYALPKRLIIGLLTLFLSITTMTVAFSSALLLVSGHKNWILVLVAALACLPVTSFVCLQFPLLVDLISSTYGRGIFVKQSNRQFF